MAARIDVLTAREREVLVLIARGLSNGEMPRSSSSREQTVKTHVGRIHTLLTAFDSRLVLAYETGAVSAQLDQHRGRSARG